MAGVEITITGVAAYVTIDGDKDARPVMHGATVKVSKEEADRLVTDGVAVRGDELPAEPTTDDAPFDVDNATVPELRAEVERLELEIEGTGNDGKVVKADLVNALKAAQA